MSKSWGSEHDRQRFLTYQRKRRATFKAMGICPNCEKNPSVAGKTCCRQCLEDKKLTLLFGTAGPYRQLYAELFERQHGLCGICRFQMKRPTLDYCPKTMIVRGLLCFDCRIGLRKFNDSIRLLKYAMDYVENNAGIGIVIRSKKLTSRSHNHL